MSLCDTCRVPGACCRMFVLNCLFDPVNWKEEATKLMAKYGVPYFKPIAVAFNGSFVFMGGHRHHHPQHPQHEGKVSVHFNCDNLLPNGRCGIYNERPETCSTLEPGSDPLCGEYRHNLRGIPIVVESQLNPK